VTPSGLDSASVCATCNDEGIVTIEVLRGRIDVDYVDEPCPDCNADDAEDWREDTARTCQDPSITGVHP
jgi:hypothetical protein